MNDFFNTDIIISEICIALYLPGLSKRNVHIHDNRANYGFAIHTSDCDKYFEFENGKTFHVTKNTIIFMPKNSNYIVREETPGSAYAINFDVLNETITEPFLIKTKNTSLFLESFRQVTNVWNSYSPETSSKCMRELYNIIYNIKKEYRLSYISSDKSEKIAPAIDYIHANYAKGNISIPYLAELCSISETYLRQIFLSSFGTSPAKYISNLKLTYAAELLKSEMYSVYDTMTMSGYEDEAYFSRTFKKKFGVPPSEYKIQKTTSL